MSNFNKILNIEVNTEEDKVGINNNEILLNAQEVIKSRLGNKNIFRWVNNGFKFRPMSIGLRNIYFVIWLNKKGKICYKPNYLNEYECLSTNEASNIISSIFGAKVKFGYKTEEQVKSEQQSSQYKENHVIEISLSSLNIVYEEAFLPNIPQEFIFENSSCIKNKFTPSKLIVDVINVPNNLQLPDSSIYNPPPPIQYSIILELLYHAVGFNQEKFLYLLNWLAIFFQNPGNRLNTALVFVGKDNLVIDFLFQNIISQLFRKEYCLQIDSEMLELKGLFNLLEEKLFYYFKDISINDNNKFDFKSLITKNEFYIEKNKCYPKKFKNFGQVIISTNNYNIPFLEKDGDYYSVFQATPLSKDTIDKLLAECRSQFIYQQDSFASLESALTGDLSNFANILKSFTVDYDIANKPLMEDDSAILIKSVEDKVKSFSDAIITKDIEFLSHIRYVNSVLYKEVLSDFENNIFRQPNLIKCFNILYPEEENMIAKNVKDQKYKTRMLMKLLKQIDNKFFAKENISINSAGLKYFQY